MSEKLPEYIEEIERVVTSCADDIGVEKLRGKEMARMVVKGLSHEWGGMSIYFLKGLESREKIKLKHQQIIDEYNGTNVRELVRKFNVSQQWIYDIVREKAKSMNRDMFKD